MFIRKAGQTLMQRVVPITSTGCRLKSSLMPSPVTTIDGRGAGLLPTGEVLLWGAMQQKQQQPVKQQKWHMMLRRPSDDPSASFPGLAPFSVGKEHSHTSAVTKRLVLIRHGKSLANYWRDYYGIDSANPTISFEEYKNLNLGDVPLTEEGRDQALSLNKMLVEEKIIERLGETRVQIWASPMRRAVETAQIIFGDRRGINKLTPEAREYFPSDYACGSPTATIKTWLRPGLDYFHFVDNPASNVHCEPHLNGKDHWDKTYASVNDIIDPFRMDRLHNQIMHELFSNDSKTDTLFVVCHWGTIFNYVNRFCDNLARTDNVKDHYHFLEDGFETLDKVEMIELHNCAMQVMEFI